MSHRPLPLIAGLAVTTAIVTAVLGWLVWRLLAQQHAIDEQRARDHLERSADAVSARIGERFADAGERLTTWASGDGIPTGLPDGVVVTITANGSVVAPQGSLPFVPFTRPVSSPLPPAFMAAEAVELGGSDDSRAIAMYRALSTVGDAPHRAVALMRLAVLQRRSGDIRGALESYDALTSLDTVAAGHLHAGLVGLYGRHATLRAAGDAAQAAAASDFVRRLDRGDWSLTRGQAEHYPPSGQP